MLYIWTEFIVEWKSCLKLLSKTEKNDAMHRVVFKHWSRNIWYWIPEAETANSWSENVNSSCSYLNVIHRINVLEYYVNNVSCADMVLGLVVSHQVVLQTLFAPNKIDTKCTIRNDINAERKENNRIHFIWSVDIYC